MDCNEYIEKKKIQEKKFPELRIVEFNERVNELTLRMERLGMCMGSGMINVKEQDRDILASLCRNGYYVEYVQIWGSVYIKCRSKRSWCDYYEEKVIDGRKDATQQDEKPFECIMHLMDRREEELKELAKNPPIEEVIPQALEYVHKYLPTNGKYKYQADTEHGKRAYDSKSFDAIVIRYSDNSYCGLIELARNKFGEYYMKYAMPLAGECEHKTSIENLEADIKSAVHFMTC